MIFQSETGFSTLIVFFPIHFSSTLRSRHLGDVGDDHRLATAGIFRNRGQVQLGLRKFDDPETSQCGTAMMHGSIQLSTSNTCPTDESDEFSNLFVWYVDAIIYIILYCIIYYII